MAATPALLILAAGKGTRMKSERPKVLHAVAWRPMLAHVLDAARELGATTRAVVVGHGAAEVTAAFASDGAVFVEQKEQRGTGHAAQVAKSALEKFSGTIVILAGDVPLVRAETLRELVAFRERMSAPIAVATIRLENPAGYGRIVRDAQKPSFIAKIVEHRDASAAEKEIEEINSGIYACDSAFLWSALDKLHPANAQKELYLTDIVGIAAKAGTPAVAFLRDDAWEFEGINDRAQLAHVEEELFSRVNARHMADGVTLRYPKSIRIDPRATLGRDVEIHPRVEIRGACVIGDGTVIETGCVLEEVTLGRNVLVRPYTLLEKSKAGDGCIIGPFARIRPESDLAEGVHVGNFVETKKTSLGKGSKANHLAYLGDAKIGAGVNVGAGTITCNYDGFNKHQTTIEDGVFVGSDTQFVAPVTVGKDAVIGAGSTITKNVTPGALALTRAKQVEIEGYAAKHRAKGAKK